MSIEKLKPLAPHEWEVLTDDEALLYALILVGQKAPRFDSGMGICGNVLRLAGRRENAHLGTYMHSSFPVRSMRPGISSSCAFFTWPLWAGAYGKEREAYLNRLIVRVAKNVNKANERGRMV